MMNRTFLFVFLGAGLALSLPRASTLAAEASVITTGTLLEEMIDLDRLARWPEPAYRTIQFSSRLRSDYAPRLLNVNLKPVELQAGSRELMIECVDAGVVGLDYLWLKGE